MGPHSGLHKICAMDYRYHQGDLPLLLLIAVIAGISLDGPYVRENVNHRVQTICTYTHRILDLRQLWSHESYLWLTNHQ
jgi:hypothetical protein